MDDDSSFLPISSFESNGYEVLTIDFRHPELSKKINILTPIINEYKNYIEWLEFYRDIFVIYRENNYELKSEKMNDFLLNKRMICYRFY